jgi:hypothetical protein
LASGSRDAFAQVTVQNGWVTLRGEATWGFQREAAANAVWYVRGVRGVTDEIGTHVEERDLESQARMVLKGTPIDELERLARQLSLVAQIQETTVEGLARILGAGQLPIAFIDQAIFDLTPAERTRQSSAA